MEAQFPFKSITLKFLNFFFLQLNVASGDTIGTEVNTL